MTGFDLAAALEDAEGHALAQDIIDRKKYRNIRDRFMQQLIWGDVLTDGHGNVIPRELPGYWSAVKDAWDDHVEAKLTHTRSLAGPPVTVLRGPAIHVTWTDEPWQLVVGGRGHGKVFAQKKALQQWESRTRPVIPDDIPEIASIRWPKK